MTTAQAKYQAHQAAIRAVPAATGGGHRFGGVGLITMMTYTPWMRAACALSAAVVLAMSAGLAHATGGGVDENGCHDSAKKGFHCHPERAKKSGGTWVGSTSTDRTQAERDKRLKRECKGRPNAGACLGYATP